MSFAISTANGNIPSTMRQLTGGFSDLALAEPPAVTISRKSGHVTFSILCINSTICSPVLGLSSGMPSGSVWNRKFG
nr:hypothetical protein Itr_chr02CG24790 [Ipomoea trifida]